MWSQKSFILRRTCVVVLASLCLAFTLKGSAQNSYPIVSTLAWNADGTKLAVGYQFGPLDIFDPQSGQLLFSDTTFQLINALDWSPAHESYLAIGGNTANQDGLVEIIDAASEQVILSLEGGGSILSVAWSPDGSKIAASSSPIGNSPTERSEVRIWNAETGEMILTAPPMSTNSINAIDWKPDGRQLAGAVSDHSVVIWDTTTGDVVQTLQHEDAVISIAWSPDGDKLASASSIGGNELSIWNTTTWETITTFPSRFGTVQWSPDGNELAVGEYLSLKVLDANSGRELLALSTDKLERAVAYSPFGGRLAFGGEVSPYADSVVSSDIDHIAHAIADGAVRIIVPNPSLDRLQNVVRLCNLPSSTEQSITGQITADNLDNFIAGIRARSDETISPACAADLIAVAEAIQSR